MSKKYLRLSYFLNNNTPTYDNSAEIEISPLISIKNNDSCNKSFLKISSHVGTHIDFPYHFLENGLKGESFNPEDLIFDNVSVLEINNFDDFLLVENISTINLESIDKNSELILIKTGFCQLRNQDVYWNKYPALSVKFSELLIKSFPKLKAIGLDLISVASPHFPREGSDVHKILLSKNVLIIEDMDLSKINVQTELSKVIVAPLLFENCDGSPCNIIAEF